MQSRRVAHPTHKLTWATRARQVRAVPLPNPRPRPTVTTPNPLTWARKQTDAGLSFLIWLHLAKTNRIALGGITSRSCRTK